MGNPFDRFDADIEQEGIQGNPFDMFDQAGSTSTITGEQIPTGEEKISQSNQAIRTMGPIIGDVAMTAATPQLKGAGLGIKALNLLMRAGGAGVGGGAGDIAAQKLTSDAPIDFESAGNQAMTGAAGEVIGSGVMAAPMAAAKGSMAVGRRLPFGLDKGFDFVTDIYRKAQNKFTEKTTKRAVKFLDDMKAGQAIPEKEIAGMDVKKAITGKDEFGEIYKDYNNLIDKAADSNGELMLDDFNQKLADLVQSEMTKSGNKNWGQALSAVKDRLSLDKKSSNIINDLFANDKIDVKDAKYLIAKMKGNYKTDSQGLVNLKDDLQKTMLDDIGKMTDTGSEAIAAREKATEIFAATKQWFRDNPLAKTISKKPMWSGGYTVDRLLKGSADEVKNIKDAVIKTPEGKKAWAGVEFSFLDDLYGRHIKDAGTGSGKKRLLPDPLAEEIYAKEEWIKKVMPDLWPKLKAEADFYKEAAPQFETLGVGEIWSNASAWEVLSPKSRKLLTSLASEGSSWGKVGLKSVGHGMVADGEAK